MKISRRLLTVFCSAFILIWSTRDEAALRWRMFTAMLWLGCLQSGALKIGVVRHATHVVGITRLE